MVLYNKAGAKYFVSMGVQHNDFDVWDSSQLSPIDDVSTGCDNSFNAVSRQLNTAGHFRFSFGLGVALVTLTVRAQMVPDPTAATNAATNAATAAPFGSCHVHLHDPSTIVQCGGQFWVFYTGHGIPSYHSKDLKTWEPGPRVFTSAPAWTDPVAPGDNFWAPDIIHQGNRYLLYYAVSKFGRNESAIGLASNPTLDPGDPQFHWTDEGLVVRSTATNDFNAIDPAVCREVDGELWLAFGSFWSGIKLIPLDAETGKAAVADSRMYSLAHNDSIEASYIYFHDHYYYLFVNWGLCCRGTNSTYEIRVGRSEKITGPYDDADGVDMMTDGGTLFLKSNGAFIGPGHAGIIAEKGADWFSCHFYDGTRRGMSTLGILPLQWRTNGWPQISAPP